MLFNVAAVHTQMGAKHDRRCLAGRDDEDGAGRSPSASADGGPEPPAAVDGAAAAAQCFLRAAGAYRHIGDTFANAPARAADLRATGVLYTLMMVSIISGRVQTISIAPLSFHPLCSLHLNSATVKVRPQGPHRPISRVKFEYLFFFSF